MKISFDFDSTLSKPSVQEYAKKLIDAGHEVCIITTRYEDVNRYWFTASHYDLETVAEKLGITDITFTNMVDKYHEIKSKGIQLHFDDDFREHETIQKYTDCRTIQIKKSRWKEKADKIINEEL